MRPAKEAHKNASPLPRRKIKYYKTGLWEKPTNTRPSTYDYRRCIFNNAFHTYCFINQAIPEIITKKKAVLCAAFLTCLDLIRFYVARILYHKRKINASRFFRLRFSFYKTYSENQASMS